MRMRSVAGECGEGRSPTHLDSAGGPQTKGKSGNQSTFPQFRPALNTLAALVVLGAPSVACAAGGDLHVPMWSAGPFALLLLAIALFPLLAGHWWH